MAKDNPLLQGLNRKTAAPVAATDEPAPARRPRPAIRKGTKLVGGHFPEEVSISLKVLAAENRTTIQDLMADAINGIFAKYGKPQIATVRSREEA